MPNTSMQKKSIVNVEEFIYFVWITLVIILSCVLVTKDAGLDRWVDSLNIH
jgi:hypothetical protein